MIVLCGNAELALARGDVERGLILYRDAVVALKARSIPGVDVATELTPWVLFPEAGALAAHARQDTCASRFCDRLNFSQRKTGS